MTAASDPRAARNDAERELLDLLRNLPNEAARRAYLDTLRAMANGADLHPPVAAVLRAFGADNADAAAGLIVRKWEANRAEALHGA